MQSGNLTGSWRCVGRKDFSPSCVIKRANKGYANEAFFAATRTHGIERRAAGSRHWIISRTFMQNITYPFTNLTLALWEQWITHAKQTRRSTDVIAMKSTYRGRNLKILTGGKTRARQDYIWWTEEISARRNELRTWRMQCGLFALSRVTGKSNAETHRRLSRLPQEETVETARNLNNSKF